MKIGSALVAGRVKTNQLILACLITAGAATGCSRDPAAATRRYIASGDRYLQSGKPRDAAIEYRNAIKATPESADAHTKLANAAALADDGATAASEYLVAASLAPDDTGAQVRAAAVSVIAGRFEEARDRARATLAAAPNDANAHLVLGEALAALHDAKESEASLREATRLAPQSIQARIALASAYWADGRPSDAEVELRRAYAAAPGDASTNRALALLMMVSDRTAAAEPFWRTVAGARNGNPVALADYYISVNRLEDAQRELQRVLQGPGTHDAAAVRLATVQHARGQASEAYATVDALLGRDRSNEFAQLMRAQLLLADGRVDAALAATDAARNAHPTSARPLLVRGRVLEARGDQDAAIREYETALKLNPGDASPNLAIARLRLAQGRPDDAVDWASRAHAAGPDDIQSALVLIDALTAQHNTARAEQEAGKAIERWPRVSAFHVRLAAVNVESRHQAQARQELDEALRIDPNSIDAMTVLTAMDIREGRSRAAIARTAARLREHPADPSLLLLSAQTSFATGHSDDAEATLIHLIDLEPTQLDGYAALGRLYVQQRRLEEARTQFMRLAAHSTNPSAATMVGMILETQGMTDAARRQYEDVLAGFPRAGVAANNLACIYVRDGRLDDALRLARIASEEVRRRPEVNDTLGWVHVQRHEGSLAVVPLAAAVEAQPDNPTYRYHLGVAYVQKGDVVMAQGELRRALSSTRPFDDRAAAAKLLAAAAAAR